MTPRPQAVAALIRFSLTTQDAPALAKFFEAAFGCRRLGSERRGADALRPLGVQGGALAEMLALGEQQIELLQFDEPGRVYPSGASAIDLSFQHFAILVTDMDRAFAHLSAIPGWSAISRDGPQQLPQRSGGVTAYKFRDPEGHPLELLKLAATPLRVPTPATQPPFKGIDHSAISVSDTMKSVAFYEQLGLRIRATSYNSGVEQERLDGVDAPRVEVTALSPPRSKPHLELLCYRRPRAPACAAAANNDVVATRLIFQRRAAATADVPLPMHCIDPDGHHLIIE